MKYQLHHGDCLAILPTLEDCSVDAIVTDPPAGIAFMGKAWDRDKGGKAEWIDWMFEVALQCRRVIKPGGHALVWAIPRTSHWTGSAWEDAGWQVRDKIYHVFGSGFPKSMDVSKQLDRMAGAEREVVGDRKLTGKARILSGGNFNGEYKEHYRGSVHDYKEIYNITAPATTEAKQWAGWGTALKPAAEEWWLFRRPLEGTVAANVLKHGTGAINVDGCRVGSDGGTTRSEQAPYGESGWRTGHKIEEINAGRWPANFTHDGSDEVTALQSYVMQAVRASDNLDAGKKYAIYNDDRYGLATLHFGNAFKDFTITPEQSELLHAAIGIAGEAGELLAAVRKHVFDGHDLDVGNCIEEMGDLGFFFQAMLHALGVDRAYIEAMNQSKLSKRYEAGYSDQQAQERKDKQ